MRFLSDVSSMIVAAVLLFTGSIHAAQPYFFIHTIASYRLLSADVSGLLGLWLPYLQIVLGLCIGLRIAEKVALCIAAGVFTTFALAQTAVLMRGMEIDCGCFGFVAHTVSPSSIALPIALAVICALAVVVNRGFERHEVRSERPASTCPPSP
jgi:putative oxidoreductase